MCIPFVAAGTAELMRIYFLVFAFIWQQCPHQVQPVRQW
jgi:hypothetical protein